MKRRRVPKMGLREPSQIRCPGHLAWVRGCVCLVDNDGCSSRMEAHHVKTRGAGGGDDVAVPLCSTHHGELHTRGRETFERRYELDLLKEAKTHWLVSPHGKKHRAAEREAELVGPLDEVER